MNVLRSIRNPAVRHRCLTILLLALSVTGCRTGSGHSPTIDVLGSYFPAWLICIVVGLGLTIIARLVLIALKLNAHLRPAPIVYSCLLVIFTLVIWLTLFKN